MYLLSENTRPFAILKNLDSAPIAIDEEFGVKQTSMNATANDSINTKLPNLEWGECREFEAVAIDEDGNSVVLTLTLTKLVTY